MSPDDGARHHRGLIAWRSVGGDRELHVFPTTYGRARLALTYPRDPLYYSEGWCFPSPESALAAMAQWSEDAEPAGWIRHLPSNRRRPDGDPSREFIEP